MAQKYENGNFTAVMTEVDNASNASSMVSCFNGADEVEIEELRRMRNVIFGDRAKLIAEYARIQLLEEDEFDTDSPDYDLFRLRWLRNVIEYVRTAREYYESGRISHDTLTAAASAMTGIEKCWNKTKYFNQDNPYHAQQLPTKKDMLKPAPQIGEKRNISDFSIATGTLAVIPPGKVPFPRTSSPNPPTAQRQVDEVALQPQPTSQQQRHVDEELQQGVKRDEAVQRWVNSTDPTTPSAAAAPTIINIASTPTPSVGARRMLEASRLRQQKELEDLRKERDELRQVVAKSQVQLQEQLAASEKATTAKVTAAANVAFEQEMAKREKDDLKKAEEAREALANARLDADHARQRAEKATNDLAQAEAFIHQQRADLRQNEEVAKFAKADAERMRNNLQAVKDQAAIAEKDAENVRQILGEKEKELEAERGVNAAQMKILDARTPLLPAFTPANGHTSPKRFAKGPSPKKQGMHPLHEQLHQRQKSQELPLIDLTKQTTTRSTYRTSSTQNANAVQERINGAYNAGSRGNFEYEDTFIRCKQLHVDQMRGARPSNPFSKGTPVDFSIHMKAFEKATRYPTLTDEDRMDEIIHWFAGEAAKVVRLHQLNMNHQEAYRDVCIELDSLFRENQDSFGTTIRAITRGKPIDSNDYSNHLALYTQLREAQSVIMTAGNGANANEFNRRDVIRDILNARLPHLTDRFWREDEKSKRTTGRPYAFQDLLNELQQWLSILRAKNPEGFEAANAKKAVIAAIASAPKTAPTYANRLVESPPKMQNTSKCNECGGLHETASCNVLLAMTVEQRVEALSRRGLCFHCMNPGHRASSCTQRPTCQKCSRKHATMLHDRKFESPKKKSSMSAAALPFRPFVGNAATTTTTNNAAAASDTPAQQEAVL